ncbi:MAG: BTAD domain-containing putative transcriptional regulator [Sporichthyaceae bacterium]
MLGPIALHGPAGPLFAPRRAAPRTLLALLAARFGRGWPADELADALWGDDPPARPGAALQSQVFRLRRALGETGQWVETVGAGYRLAGPAQRLDAARFERLIDTAHRDTGAAALGRLEQALGLWRGRAYADTGEHPELLAEAARLTELRASAAQARVELLLELARPEQASAAAVELVAAAPYAEVPVRLLGHALAAGGRHADALAEFRRFRLRLRDDLAVEPTPALRDAEEALLRHLDPVPRAAATVRLPGNRLIGREEELADLVERIGRRRVVTVVGPGGVGKTRLALHAAALAADRYPDGLFVCELAAVADGGDVAAAIASAVGVERRAGQSPADRVAAFLSGRRVLLLLDNCEHLRAAVREVLAVLVASAATLDVLATSRTRLDTPLEDVLSLPTLAIESSGPGLAPAVELFVDRLRALRAGLELDAEGMAAVRALARRADGLPLALELATARCQTRSPVEVAADYDAHIPVDPRRGVDRHRSIDAMVGWSYDRLPAERAKVFERLSVFAGGWTADAAAALAGPRADLDAALTGLIEASMVVVGERGGGLRYAMLEPIREFANDALARRGELEVTQARHAVWAVEFVESAEVGLRSAAEGRWHRRVTAESGNLRGAHRWALNHDPGLALRLAGQYWFALWHAPAEVLDRTEETVRRYQDYDHPALPAALATAAVGAWRRGDLDRARELGERALSAAPDRLHPSARFAWEALADAALFAGEHARALGCYDAAIDGAHRAGDGPFGVEASLSRALCLGYAEQRAEAAAAIAAQREALAALDNPTCLAFADYVTVEATMPGQAGYAVRLLERAAGLAASAHSDFLADECLLTAAARRVAAGDPAAAGEHLYDLVGRWHRAGNWKQQWTTLAVCAEALRGLDRRGEATLLAAAVAPSGHLVGAVYGPGPAAGGGPVLSADNAVRYALDALGSVVGLTRAI